MKASDKPNSDAAMKQKQDAEKIAQQANEKKKARASIGRAIRHLKDWQHRLEEEGYAGMAAEVQVVINDMATPACLLGGSALGSMSMRFDEESHSWNLQGVS